MDIILFFMFALGAIIGSFLNVCIVRFPQEKSVVFPGSHCGHCGVSIAWHDNVPLLSWLILKGRCRRCKARISFRYWLVEFLTALVFVGFYQKYGLSPVLGPYLVMACCFMVATFVDFAHRIIPDQVSVGGMFAGIVLSVLVPQLHPVSPMEAMLGGFMAGLMVLICLVLMLIYPVFCRHLMEEQDPSEDRGGKILVLSSLLVIAGINAGIAYLPPSIATRVLSLSAALSGYIVGGGLILAMGLFGDIVFKKESMGGGDVKLMAMTGAFLGWKLAMAAFFLAPFFGAVYGIIEKIRTKDSTIAYGPFLVLGSLVSLLWGEQIIRWVLNGGLAL
ncbi:MAG: prepilin peptidase [Candidatus Omnitrophica bacterium]|nr:prepilin peptidase [Candidatus Omnitrophota bacterium]